MHALGNRAEGKRKLSTARALAKKHRHDVLQTYILEALALLEESSVGQRHLEEAWKIAKRSGLNGHNNRRRKNWEKCKPAARTKPTRPKRK